jgi:hypothetical protein
MKGNSIRLRLTRPEVARLADGAPIEEACEFGDGVRLTWTLQSFAGSAIRATFENGRITVSVPGPAVRGWADGDGVGIYGRSGPVDMAIEKDFRCAFPRDDPDDADAFPNPSAC